MTLTLAHRAPFLLAPTLTAFALAFSAGVHADVSDVAKRYEMDARGWPTDAVTKVTSEPPVTAQSAWSHFQSRHKGWTATWDLVAGTPVRSAGPAIQLESRPVTSNQAADAARDFLIREAGAWAKPDELTLLRASPDRNGWWVQYVQTYRGLRVVGGRAFARISEAGTVPLFGILLEPRIDIDTTPIVDEPAARLAALTDFSSETTSEVRSVERVILPLSRNGGTVYRTAYAVAFTTRNPLGSWEAYVDARTGELLWRRSLLESIDVTGSVSAGIEPVTQGDNVDVKALPHVTVSLADTGLIAETVTALDGSFLLSAPSGGPDTLSAGLSGPFGYVFNLSFGNSPLDIGFNPDSTSVFPIMFDDANSRIEDRDAFYSAMRAHDFIRALDPGFSALDYPMYLRTDYPGAQCNAFWDGYGLWFFSEGSVCANMARIASVVIHEYGHGITDYQYRPFSPSQAMHEGFSDYTAATLLNDPRIGPGFFGPGTVLRSVENNRRVPEDVSLDPHLTGLIIAGALWDVREALGAETADHLWHFARNGLSSNFDDYFFDYLLTDDDDGNVYNGTPHFDTIVAAFRHHGIGDYGIHVVHNPLRDTEDASQSFPITASFLSIFAIDDASVQVHLAIDHGSGPVEEVRPLLPTGGVREYSTLLEAQPNETIVSYWFSAQDTAGTEVVYPLGGDQNPFHFRIGTDTTPPQIVHEPLRDQPLDEARVPLYARVTDNLDKGIDSVRVYHARENDPENITILPPVGNDVYQGGMSIPGLQLGDLVRYRIQVADSAVVPNVASSPDTGWNSFHIVRGFGRDFEDNDGGLTTDDLWEWGSPEPLLHAFSGVNVWGTNLSGVYPEDAVGSLIIGPVDLSNFTTAGLYFQNFYDMETYFDSGAVYASADSGETWELLVPDGEYPLSEVYETGEAGYSGQSGDWVKAAFPLDAYVGVPNLLIKLEFLSDEAIGGLGWYVDDLEVVERQVLSRPLALTAVSGNDGQVPLSWKAPAGIVPSGPESPLLGYHVYRGFPGAELSRITAVPVPETHYVDTTPVNGVLYAYAVRAVYDDGESERSIPVEAMPYVAAFSGTPDSLSVTSPPSQPVDATLHVGNTGTGFLKMNLWPTETGETLQNARIRYTIGPGTGLAGPRPDWGSKKARGIRPAGTWQFLYQDPQDHEDVNVPDIDSLEAQIGFDSIYLRITGHRAWGDSITAWSLLASFDTDLDPGTNPLGDYAILAGAAAQSGYGNPAVLLDHTGHVIGPVHHVAYPAPNVMEFGVFLLSMGFPSEVFLSLRATNAAGDTVLDFVPNARPLPWLDAGVHRLVLSQGAEQDLPFHFFTLSAGQYFGQVLIETNDPNQPVIVLPVSYNATNIVPIDLLSFNGEANDLGIRLNWNTGKESDLLGFRVLRSEVPGGTETTLTPTPLLGDHGVYTFEDREVIDGRDYWYRLEALSRNGETQFHGPVQVRYAGVSNFSRVVLRPSMPNPTRTTASIRFGLPADANVTLRIFSVEGRLVRVLADGVHYARGFHELAWDGRDVDGRPVGAGVFPYRLEASGDIRRGKITRLR